MKFAHEHSGLRESEVMFFSLYSYEQTIKENNQLKVLIASSPSVMQEEN